MAKGGMRQCSGIVVAMKGKPPLWYTVQAILGWMLEESILVAVVLWLLPRFNVNLPLWVLGILVVALAVYSYVMYRVGRLTFLMRPKVAAEAIIGNEGKVTKRLAPEGYVKVQGVLWKATCSESELEVGDEVVVVGIEGLRLIVRLKEKAVKTFELRNHKN